MEEKRVYTCLCGKTITSQGNFSRHKKTCKPRLVIEKLNEQNKKLSDRLGKISIMDGEMWWYEQEKLMISDHYWNMRGIFAIVDGVLYSKHLSYFSRSRRVGTIENWKSDDIPDEFKDKDMDVIVDPVSKIPLRIVKLDVGQTRLPKEYYTEFKYDSKYNRLIKTCEMSFHKTNFFNR